MGSFWENVRRMSSCTIEELLAYNEKKGKEIEGKPCNDPTEMREYLTSCYEFLESLLLGDARKKAKEDKEEQAKKKPESEAEKGNESESREQEKDAKEKEKEEESEIEKRLKRLDLELFFKLICTLHRNSIGGPVLHFAAYEKLLKEKKIGEGSGKLFCVCLLACLFYMFVYLVCCFAWFAC